MLLSEYLEDHNIITTRSEASSSGSVSSATGRTANVERQEHGKNKQEKVVESRNEVTTNLTPARRAQALERRTSAFKACTKADFRAVVEKDGGGYLPPSDSEESLSIKTRDSVEDLPSAVPRSPLSPKSPASPRSPRNVRDDAEGVHSPTKLQKSPRQRLKKNLTINLDGVDFNLENRKRLLSPFTPGGMLRTNANGFPPSAPAATTEFGPTLRDEVDDQIGRQIKDLKIQVEEKPYRRTTRAERGGKSLMGFIGRRIGSKGDSK